MKWFQYADEQVSERELMIAVPSMMIGVGILSLPKDLAAVTSAADGWLVLLIGGIITMLTGYLLARVGASFPHQSFITYTSTLVTKPIAILITFIYTLIAILMTAYEVREISFTSKLYLFEHTPIEVIALSFLLVVVYAVTGSRVGLLRLNMMFLPIILFIAFLIVVLNIGLIDFGNFLPMFKTDVKGYLDGMMEGSTSYLGLSIIVFYVTLVREPRKAPKKVVVGIGIAMSLYILLFIACILIFGNRVTTNLIYPVIELGKEVEIPGGFFERFESVFFVTWIMAIFNTTAMAFDIAVLSLHSIFQNVSKRTIVFCLSPLIFLISMYPNNIIELADFGMLLGRTAFFYSIFLSIVLFTIVKLKGVGKNNEI